MEKSSEVGVRFLYVLLNGEQTCRRLLVYTGHVTEQKNFICVHSAPNTHYRLTFSFNNKTFNKLIAAVA